MDPSSGRDKDSNSREPENPFIKFKNFADSQVSSLLQGIIGLPSVISRRSTEQNRWADIDEDLRRRDQLQARQAQLKQAAEKTNGNSVMSGGEIPVKKSAQHEPSQTSAPTSRWQNLVNGKEALNGENDNSPKAGQDLPLYSPVTKELFERLNTGDGFPSLLQGLSGFPTRKYDSGLSLPVFDPMAMINDISLSMLRTSAILHSEYSLLPYLLSSPYSPVKLELEERPSVTSRGNKLQYCAAFEDLIRTSQGRESSTRSSFNKATKISKSLFFGFPGQNHLLWILLLHGDGILQQKRQTSDPVPDLKAWRAIGNGHGSDLDMFEHVQRFSQILDPSIIFRDLFNGNERNNDDEEPFQNSQLQTGRNLQIWSKEEAGRAYVPGEGKDLKNGPATDKVVTTHTTTERTTHEGGTVETTLTIWKQFEDGRESTTTTHHIEEPAWSNREPDERTPKQEAKVDKEEKKEKRGWFWN